MSHPKRIWADFNGLFRGEQILCLSHSDTSRDEDGTIVQLAKGMQVTAYMEDFDDAGNRDDLTASGIVEPSPEWLQQHGSKWVLVVDQNGVRHQSELRENLDP